MAADKGSGAGGSASAEIGKYLDILAKDPDSRVFAPLAEAYRKAGLLDDAIETAREGLSVHPNYMGGRVALGRALFEKKSYAEAAEEMRKVAKAAPDNIIAHKVLGQIALAQGSLPDAEKSFRMVVLLDPHDKEAKQALADIGAGGPAPAVSSAASAAPASSAAPQGPVSVQPPAAEKSWGELTLDGGGSMEGLERHQAPADTAPAAAPPEPFPMDEIAVGPSAIELEEPDEIPETLPDIDIPPEDSGEEASSPAAGQPGPPAIELQQPSAIELREPPAIELPPFDLEVPPPIDVPALDLPEPPATTTPESEPVAEFEIFSREPAGLSLPVAAAGVGTATPPESPATGTPVEDESPFEVFGRPKRGGPATTKGEREAYAEIEIEPTGHAAAAEEPDAGQESVFEIFTREPRVEGGAAARPARGERPAFEQIEVEPTAYVPPEPQEGELPVIELREEIPRIDVQGELELALEMERAPADATPQETAAGEGAGDLLVAPEIFDEAPAATVPAAAGEEIGWEEEPSWQAEPAGDTDDAAPLLTPEEAATEELVWDATPEAAPEPAAPTVEVSEPVAERAPEPVNEFIFEPPAEPTVEPAAGIIPELVAPAAPEPAGQETAETVTPPWVPPAEEILTLEEEIPSVDLAGEVMPEEPAGESAPEATAAADEGEDAFADFDTVGEPAIEAMPAAEPESAAAGEEVASPEVSTPAAGRGVFDTETLASIYINQGFYGRAAAIYERLSGANPDDAGLRLRLEEVRGLERANTGAAVAGAAAPETTPAGRDRAETIRRLEALLTAFRGVKPR